MKNYEYEIIENGLVEYKKESSSKKIIGSMFKKTIVSALSLGFVFGAGYAGASLAIRNVEPLIHNHNM